MCWYHRAWHACHGARSLTGAPLKLAQEFLKRYSWSLDQAVDTFFTEAKIHLKHSSPSHAVGDACG